MNPKPQSETERIYAEYDEAVRAVNFYAMANHSAYLEWTAEERLSFDRGKL